MKDFIKQRLREQLTKLINFNIGDTVYYWTGDVEYGGKPKIVLAKVEEIDNDRFGIKYGIVFNNGIRTFTKKIHKTEDGAFQEYLKWKNERELYLKEEINNNNNQKEIIVFHRSNSLEHMKNNQFDLEYSDKEYSIFGRALYFASSGQISNQLGKYLCKFKIKLDKPILNLNKIITNKQANNLLKLFNQKYNTKIDYYNKQMGESINTFDFNENYDGIQYGEFFLELQDILKPQPNQYYEDFIRNVLKYNSFVHYGSYGTDFITEKGDYGLVYGIYNPKDIKFVEGPY